jgi:tetratricopeptide (TPR) repeat protein
MLGILFKNLFSRGNDAVLARAAFDAGAEQVQKGDLGSAAESFERAIALDPAESEYHHVAAIAHLKLGRLDQARSRCESALALDPTLPDLHTFLSQLRLPGPFYVDLLQTIHRHLRPRTYLEIGVETGQTLCLALPETRAIGVDPQPILRYPLSQATTLHVMTSDDYFAGHDVQAELGGLPIDLAFIDGMHHFEFALRDFINIEKNCDSRSTILIHDCYPLDRLTAERERHCMFWSGDIWRLMLALRKYRPELQLHTVGAAPTGLGVARGLDPRSRVLEEKFDGIVREFLALDYSVLDTDKPGMLALYPNDWERIKTLLN